jgi:hypothetical protein
MFDAGTGFVALATPGGDFLVNIAFFLRFGDSFCPF